MGEQTGGCCKTVPGSGGWHRYPCSRKGIVEVNGKWYCKQHSPAEVARRREASSKRYLEQTALAMRPFRQAKHAEKLAEALRQLLDHVINPLPPLNRIPGFVVKQARTALMEYEKETDAEQRGGEQCRPSM